MNGIKKYAGALLIGGFLLLHLVIMPSYGFTWDFHFHFFGGGHLLGFDWQELESRALPYVEPDPRRAWSLPYGPIMSVPPVASFMALHKWLGILPADSAYHLPIILWGTLGVIILYFFLKEAVNKQVALIGAIFLAVTPRYFGDMHNNMKDIPSSVVFALNMWLIWRLVTKKRLIDLLLATSAFAVAFSVKINSVFIPMVFAVWYILTHIPFHKPTKIFSRDKLILLYWLIAPIFAFFLWSAFWPNPLFQLEHAYRTFGIGTNNIEVLLNGAWYCSGSTVPWYYPFWYLGITTPLPILVFCIISIVRIIKSAIQKTLKPIELLLVCWLFVPLARYIFPQVGVIDGVRHFEEALIPIAALAALSFSDLIRFLAHKQKSMSIALIIGIASWLVWNIVSYHPYQITYFNELVGGVRGAYGRYDLDYWGTSQKAAVLWVNEHAPKNAKVHIVMAANVAGTYLRPDLLPNLNKFGYDESDFVIFLNRQSFFYRFFYSYEYLLVHKPVHTIEAQGTPLTWIFDNRTDNVIQKQSPWWQEEDPCIIKYWSSSTP
ncbi:glycosyltransferase family 39 protein [Candidatus Woesebacteria bacterium]|jgi:hypothetical protein|nr:glycosyltransferase family 39 protein [Candidatus Woesebacteria bacterium]